MKAGIKIWIDGKVVDEDEARIPVTDHGLLYGDGIFEGIRVYRRRIFRLDDHMARFAAGARALGLEIPGGSEFAKKVALETARAYGEDEAYMRLVVTRGSGALGVDPTTCGAPRMFCIADAIRLYPPEKLEVGIDLVTASLRRPALDALDPRVKSLNYLNSVLAKREARMREADEALLLNAAGHIAEASVANVFVVRRGELVTPPANDGALEGVTRRTILELADELGIPNREVSLSRFDLFSADEVFLTGTGARIVPVANFDGAPIGVGNGNTPGGRGPITSRIDAAFSNCVERLGTPF